LEPVVKSGTKRKRGLGDDLDSIAPLLAAASSDAPPTKMKKEDEEDRLTLDTLLHARTTAVGYVTPTEDFRRMLGQKEDLVEEAVRGLCACIRLLVEESGRDSQYEKAMECVEVLREGCVHQQEAEAFNAFLTSFRDFCAEKRRVDFWDLLVSRKVTLISSDESTSSTVLPEDARKVRALTHTHTHTHREREGGRERERESWVVWVPTDFRFSPSYLVPGGLSGEARGTVSRLGGTPR
jgi:hypothetical protein